MTPIALGAFLAQHDDQERERDIYYISRTLVGYELNYTPMEKACLVVVFTPLYVGSYSPPHIKD